MNGATWVWVLEKAWKLDMNVLQKKEFNNEFENDARLNRKPMK